MTKFNRWLLLVLLLAGVACGPKTYDHGVLNLYQVDKGIWRSGQPTSLAQWSYLASLGITKDVKLNFREEGVDDDATRLGITIYEFSIEPHDLDGAFERPDSVKVAQADAIIDSSGGVLIHCTNGWDRTGYLVGRRRVRADHWTTAEAYDEMLKYGFHKTMYGLQQAWESFAAGYPQDDASTSFHWFVSDERTALLTWAH